MVKNSAHWVELQVLEIIETVEQNPKVECGEKKPMLNQGASHFISAFH